MMSIIVLLALSLLAIFAVFGVAFAWVVFLASIETPAPAVVEDKHRSER